MTPRDLVLRADSGPGVGHGHVARCLSIAEAWRGGKRFLVVGDLSARWRSQAEDAAVEIVDPAAMHELAVGATVVVDGYRLDPAVVPSPGVLAVVDDFGFGPVGGPVDVLVDPSTCTGRSLPEPYRGARRLLIGPRYAPIRRALRPGGSSRPGCGLLVSLGGSPSTAIVQWADAVVSHLDDERVVHLAGVSDVKAVLEGCDLAVAAAGSTVWELCRFGIPIVAVAVAENQWGVLDTIDDMGVGVALGHVDDVSPEAAAAVVRVLRQDADRCRRMATRARRLVDGRGAARIAAAVRSASLRCRAVTSDDAAPLFEWANDPLTRGSSFSTAPIGWEEHRAWLRAAIDDPTTSQLMIEEEGRVVATFRISGVDEGTVGVTVAPDERGRGLAAPVIDAASDFAFRSRPELSQLRAEVKRDNERSAQAFLNADYDFAGHGTRGGKGCDVFVRHRPEEHSYR